MGLIGAVAAYTALFGQAVSQRYWAFQTYAWDLGVYNQGMWTATFSHRLFYYTADLPSGNPGSVLSAHFSPILFLVVPFYALAPNPSGLLVIQTAALGAGALPLYLLSRRAGLPEGWASLIAMSYLLSPVVMGVGWYDFHPEALIPATVLWAIYAYYHGSRWTFVISWILALAVIETISALLFLFGVASLVALAWRLARHSRDTPQDRVRALFATVVPLAWVGLVAVLSQALFQGSLGTLSTGYSSAYSLLGPNLTFYDVVPYALLHPGAALSAVSFETSDKLAYVLVLFGSFAFLSLLGPKRLLVPVVGWMILVVLSNGRSLYEFGDQNAAYPLPFVAAGAALGLARLRKLWWAGRASSPERSESATRQAWRRRFRTTSGPLSVASAVVFAVGLSSILVSPLLPNPEWNYSQVSHGLPIVTAHDDELHGIIDSIPASASVLTVSQIFPEVSSRVDAYVVPISSSFRGGNSFVSYLDQYVNESTYVLLDTQVGFYGSSVILRFANLSEFGIAAEEDGIILLERGWSGPPRLWVPESIVWAGGALDTTAYSYADGRNSTSYGSSLSSLPNTPSGSLLWFGPYVYGLAPGVYSVTFWLTVNSLHPGPQVKLDSVRNPLSIILTQQGATSSAHSYGFQFSTGPSSNANTTTFSNLVNGPSSLTENFTLMFRWSALEVWSVAGWSDSNSTLVRLYSVSLQQLSP